MKALMILAGSIVIAGCAVDPYSPASLASNSASSSDDAPAVICRKEKPTGSNRPVQVCRAAPGTIEAEQTERDMKTLQRQSEMILSRPD